MADGIDVTGGSWTGTAAADEIGGVKHQRVKVQFGADGSATDVADASNAQLPVGGSGATALGKAIDAVAGASDVGVAILAIRDDTLSALTPVEGDWSPLRVGSTGALHVIMASNSGVDIGDMDVTTMPADSRTVDSHSSALATDAIMENLTALTPKFAVIDAATSGDNTLLAAVASKKIRVLSLFLVSAGTVNVRFESGASGTALTGQMNLVVNTGFCLPFNPVGWFQTATNTLLNLELSGNVSVDGCFTYVEVT